MRAIAIAISTLALACGSGSDTGVSAGPGEGTRTAQGQRCLDLIDEKKFDVAVPACSEAVRQSPESQEVSDALEQARVAVEAGAAEARASAEAAARRAE